MHKDGTRLAKRRDLCHEPLAKDIYFSPTYSPLVHVRDYQLGSCFRDWLIPSGSFQIHWESNKVTLEPVLKDVQIDHYRSRIWQTLMLNLEQIYRAHQQVNLCFSGGIDSMVVLAMVLHLDLLHRTKLVILRNWTQAHESCLHRDPIREHKLSMVLDQLRPRCSAIEQIDITIDSVQACAADFAQLRCYTTSTLLTREKNQAWIFGFHGNQLLLHKDIFAHEILIQSPEKSSQLADLYQSKNFYTTQLKDLHVHTDLIGIERRHLLNRPWSWFDHHNSNRIYAPLASHDMFDLCRRLDFSTLDIGFIADAVLARDIITMANQAWLMQFLHTESVHEIDNLENMQVCVENIDLKVPELNHHEEGLQWILEQCEIGRHTGIMPINSLVSVKNLQWISRQ